MFRKGLTALTASTLALAGGCAYNSRSDVENTSIYNGSAPALLSAEIVKKPKRVYKSGLETGLTQTENILAYNTEAVISNLGITEFNMENHEWGFAGIMIGSQPYTIKENVSPLPGERSFIAWPQERETIQVRPVGLEANLTNEWVYVFKPEMNDEGKPATRAQFRPDGEYGLRAEIKRPEFNGRQAGIVHTSHKDINLRIQLCVIDGITYSTPVAPQLSNEKSDFLLIPLNDATDSLGNRMETYGLDIKRDTGEVTILSTTGIWRGHKITLEEYEGRAETLRQAEREARRLEEIRETNPGIIDSLK